jgi:phosphatidylglycerophosphate synthase
MDQISEGVLEIQQQSKKTENKVRIEAFLDDIGKVKTIVQMVAIPFLLYHGMLFGLIDTRWWGTLLIYASAVLTIWSMVYYLRKALPEIRAKVR